MKGIAKPAAALFMAEAVKDRPPENFPVPPGVVMERIDPKTGLLAGPHSGKPLLQAFKAGQEPRSHPLCPKPRKPVISRSLTWKVKTEK